MGLDHPRPLPFQARDPYRHHRTPGHPNLNPTLDPPLTFARQHKRTRFPLRASAITQILKAAGITPPYSQAPRSPAPEIDRAHATHLLKLALGRRANLIGRLDPDQFEDILLYIIRGKTPKHVAATIRAMFPQSPPKRRPNK